MVLKSSTSSDSYPNDNFDGISGPLPVLAGRLRHVYIGYYTGYLVPGTKIGYKARMVKMPEKTWVFGRVIDSGKGQPALWVAKASDMEGVEGFQPKGTPLELGSERSDQSPLPEMADLTDFALDDSFNLPDEPDFSLSPDDSESGDPQSGA